MMSFIFRTSAMAIGAVSILFASPTISNRPSGQAVKIVNTAPTFQPSIPTQNVMVTSIVAKKDDRAEKLGTYLAAQASPLAGDAKALVEIADKYGLDWTFLPAIAGLESQYGKTVPAGSFNPYGWNNGKMSFKSWVDASETVAAGIRTRYQASGDVSAWTIGSRYAASPTWAVRVARNQNLILSY